MRYALFLSLFLLLIARPGFAQAAAPSGGGPTAGQLMQQCLSGVSQGSISDPTCTGYLAGFVGAIRIARTLDEEFPICLPEEGISNDTIVTQVSGHLAQNLEHLENSARSVVFLVLTESYPCSALVDATAHGSSAKIP